MENTKQPKFPRLRKLGKNFKHQIGVIIKKQLFDMFLLFLPIALFTVLLCISYYLFILRFQIRRERLQKITVETPRIGAYPILKDASKIPPIGARAMLIMDNDSKKIISGENIGWRFSMASTTKLMTALVALEYFAPDDILTVKRDDIEPVVAGFTAGEKVLLIDLLYAMMLPSANDAPLAIADNYPGGEEAFVKKMNEKAQSLNLYNTHYGDPIGLTDEISYSTASDLARLTSVALQNKTIADIVSTKYKTITTDRATYNLVNLNRLLGQQGINGVKTGYTQEAGEVLITSKMEQGKRLIIVVMGSENRFGDTQRLVNGISDNIEYKNY